MSSSAVAKSGVHPWLAMYLAQLAANPLRTKCITSGTLSFVQEVLASNIAQTPIQRPPSRAPFLNHLLAAGRVELKAVKMAMYGSLVSAPLGHILVGALQKAFAGRTGTAAKIQQVLASNLFIAPINTAVYLTCMAIINGAQSVDEIIRTVQGGFFAVLRIQWVTGPLSIVFAQKFLSPELWVPFFNIIQFSVGLYFNTRVKLMRIAAEKAKKDKENKGK
ncbi:hypothetical protein JAAARDRAFT_65464 [Jaapia argillacea MUCL 33604]|uniref:Uncharacterized protein n=1 Tax=Jaapia argillacea MUCL 33604 TaxID=933084 RepID=A0A067Q8V1_9AGAM|nr:hypothetical protein JAAARDRAFT_65464 [Jaapia argillacea MUCL 33604]